MTPPSSSPAFARAPVETTAPPHVPLRLAAGKRRHAARFHAAAVVVPPTLLYIAAMLTTMTIASVVSGSASGVVTKSALLAALHMPFLCGALTVLRGTGNARAADVVLLPASAGLAFAINVILPGPGLPLVALLLVAFVSAIAQPVSRAWRRRWERFRDVEATLVLTSVMDAPDALARVDAVPGLRITSLLIPNHDERRTPRVLGLPVHSRVVPALSPMRKAVVSCPRRDPAVDAIVAQLIVRRFDVVSESSVLRDAEGRVDSNLVSPLSLLMSRPRSRWKEHLYRLRDLAIAVPGLVLLAPFFAMIALAIVVDSKGGVFYLQRRLGARGRPFKVIKFRTMRKDAEARSGPVWASESDPRVTNVGRWLRRTRLDELPQLVNVVLGHMSLVGPRPERPYFFRALRRDLPLFELRTALPPGITGWAQVRGTYASDTDQARTKLDHDLYYLSKRSFGFDLAILYETFSVALSGRGSR